VVQGEANRLGQLIDDLLDFSRLGRSKLSVSRIDVEAMVQSVLRELMDATSSKGASVVVRPLPRAAGDPSMVRLIWSNLIENALKFSSRRESAEIEIGGDSTDEGIHFWIRDNGVGFHMDYIEKLFGVFQRLHHIEEFPGTGVGLAIVRRIVERHGGRVWAHGELGKGATFHFVLPKKNREAVEGADIGDR
jgi:light-regulated signal transduction histidine kinase (bacteriophytochrome)